MESPGKDFIFKMKVCTRLEFFLLSQVMFDHIKVENLAPIAQMSLNIRDERK